MPKNYTKDELENGRWVTMHGARVFIKEGQTPEDVFNRAMNKSEKDRNKLPDEIRRTYSRFIDDHSFDDKFDSDEKVWVEMLRKEKYGEQKENKKSEEIKPWSKSEEKRTQELSKFINEKLKTGGWGEFYDTDEGETVEKFDFEIPGRKNTEIRITKNSLVYTRNYDENDNRVKMGKSVKGTTHYTVSDDGETIDDSYMGYKTLADAKHATELYMNNVRKKYKK